jgi:hypothetical protein
MSEFKSSSFRNEDNSGAPDIVGVTSFTSPFYFVPPSGTTAQRPSGDGLAPGMLRFNTDIGRLEVWRGDHWATILGESPDLNGGARGVFGGGDSTISPSSTPVNTIDYVTITTLGNATDFGDLYTGRGPGGLASATRGVFFGGYAPTNSTNIHYITISSTGNSTSFGSLITARTYPTGISNGSRGVMGAGYNANQTMDYITIASTGNAVNFGTLTTPRGGGAGGASSSTRGLFAGGYTPTRINIIDYITISTTGNASDFGDLTEARSTNAGCSNSTRGVFAGGDTPTRVNTIDFVTIASLGNAQDFGDLTAIRSLYQSGASSPTRGIFGGGVLSSPAPTTVTNIIDYITILSTGNAQDFGDLSQARTQVAACSNAHGGL